MTVLLQNCSVEFFNGKFILFLGPHHFIQMISFLCPIAAQTLQRTAISLSITEWRFKKIKSDSIFHVKSNPIQNQPFPSSHSFCRKKGNRRRVLVSLCLGVCLPQIRVLKSLLIREKSFHVCISTNPFGFRAAKITAKPK